MLPSSIVCLVQVEKDSCGMLSFDEGVPDVCFESDKLVCGTLVIPETALEFGQDLVFLKMMNEALVYRVYAFILDTLCEGVEE